MTDTSNLRRAGRALQTDATAHLFAIGQAVRLKGGLAQAGCIYHITGTLPPSGDLPQYRIRNVDEHYERVATEDQLELPPASRGGAGAALIERTFGYR